MKLTDEQLGRWLIIANSAQKRADSVEILAATLESLIRELQDARADLKKRELHWEDEFLQNNSLSETDAEDMFVGRVNGVRYYKDGTKKEK